MAAGLEPAAARELERLGIASLSAERGAVGFAGTVEDGARAALFLRSAPRVSLLLTENAPADADGLHGAAGSIPWEDWLPASAPWAVRVVGTSDALRNTLFTAQLTKDAIVDRYRRRAKTPPPVDPAAPRALVLVQLDRGRARLGLDLGGASLHRRSQQRSAPAPLREDVAAGLALLADVSAEKSLCDPFCGSGTLLAEAAGVALGKVPLRDARTLALSVLPHFCELPLSEWVRERARTKLPEHAPIWGWDRDPRAVAEARAILARQGLAGHVTIETGRVPDIELPPAAPPGVVLTNPPWGLRLSPADAHDAWYALGTWARRSLAGWTLAAVSGDPEVTRALGLKAERRWPVMIGGVDARLLVYTIRARAAG